MRPPAGSSRPSTSARIAQNPARMIGSMADSVAPARITSAWSRTMAAAASPIAWVPVAQADSVA